MIPVIFIKLMTLLPLQMRNDCFIPSWCSCWRWSGCLGRDCLQWLYQRRPELAEWWAGCLERGPAASGGHWWAEPGPELSADWTKGTGKAVVPGLVIQLAQPTERWMQTNVNKKMSPQLVPLYLMAPRVTGKEKKISNDTSVLTCVMFMGEERVGESCCGDCWRWRSEVRVSGTTGGCRRCAVTVMVGWEEVGIPEEKIQMKTWMVSFFRSNYT